MLCHYDECLILFTIMLNVIMLSVIMLNIVMLSVVVPGGASKSEPCGLYYKCLTIVIYNRNDIGLYYKTRDNSN